MYVYIINIINNSMLLQYHIFINIIGAIRLEQIMDARTLVNFYNVLFCLQVRMTET